jgi:type IV pilus assembly protein PilM
MKKLQLPRELNSEELKDQAEWDMEQYLPFKLEEANVSSSVLKENIGSLTDVFVGAAKKSLVNSYKTLIEKTQVKVKIVDLSSAAVLNVFELVHGTQISTRGTNWLLLEIGAVRSKFIVCKAGQLSFFKEINIGGNTVTEEIQRALGVTHNEAQSLKIHGDGNGNIPEEVLEIINQVLDSLVNEIVATKEFWISSLGEGELLGCVITGGGALIPGINDQIAEALGIEVTTLNPFTKMTYNKNNITEDMINEIAYQGACAIGLAMRSIPS